MYLLPTMQVAPHHARCHNLSLRQKTAFQTLVVDKMVLVDHNRAVTANRVGNVINHHGGKGVVCARKRKGGTIQSLESARENALDLILRQAAVGLKDESLLGELLRARGRGPEAGDGDVAGDGSSSKGRFRRERAAVVETVEVEGRNGTIGVVDSDGGRTWIFVSRSGVDDSYEVTATSLGTEELEGAVGKEPSLMVSSSCGANAMKLGSD